MHEPLATSGLRVILDSDTHRHLGLSLGELQWACTVGGCRIQKEDTEMETVCPGELIKEGRLQSFCSGRKVWAQPFLL